MYYPSLLRLSHYMSLSRYVTLIFVSLSHYVLHISCELITLCKTILCRFFNPSCEQLYRSSQTKQTSSELSDDKSKDSIAIPFYTLLGEIFEIHGHLQWLRYVINTNYRITSRVLVRIPNSCFKW